jgi:hypothetical protein
MKSANNVMFMIASKWDEGVWYDAAAKEFQPVANPSGLFPTEELAARIIEEELDDSACEIVRVWNIVINQEDFGYTHDDIWKEER